MKRKILILGGTQFVGRQLVESLLENNTFEVYLFNRGKSNPTIFPKAKQIIGDRETADIKRIKEHQWEFVVDFSSYYPKSLQETLKHINNNVKQYVYISTLSVLDLKNYNGTFDLDEDYKVLSCSEEEAIDTTMKTYGQKKAACEQVLSETEWLSSVILRPSIIYGKYDPTDRLYYWLRKLQFQKKVVLPDNGKHLLSLTYSNDLVEIILKCINKPSLNGVFNCSTTKPIAVFKLIEDMKMLLASKSELIDIESKFLGEKNFHLPFSFGGNFRIDNSKVRKELSMDFTAFNKSLIPVIDYYKRLNWPETNIGLNDDQEDLFIEEKQ